MSATMASPGLHAAQVPGSIAAQGPPVHVESTSLFSARIFRSHSSIPGPPACAPITTMSGVGTVAKS
jgi:hypothetical protein